ncbi:MAG TPA: TetR/AcrR family transcriptional regulator [Cyclobacteriaceae bacterium]|nr:TetR/AcrR family transcriptional regulator [Cyclobacteriaceae bacterium]
MDANLIYIDSYLPNLIVRRASNLYMRAGIKSVSMDDVAAECGISKKTLYKCFDKESLIQEVVKHHAQTSEARIKSILTENRDVVTEMTGLLLFTMDAVQEFSTQFLYSLKATKSTGVHQFMSSFTNRVHQAFIDNLNWGKAQGFYRSDVESSIVVQLYFSQLQEIVDQQGIDRSSQWIEELHSLFLFGILTPKGLNCFSPLRLSDVA